MMIGQLGWEKIDPTGFSNIWRLCMPHQVRYDEIQVRVLIHQAVDDVFYLGYDNVKGELSFIALLYMSK